VTNKDPKDPQRKKDPKDPDRGTFRRSAKTEKSVDAPSPNAIAGTAERIPTEGYFGGAAKVKNSVDAPKLDASARASRCVCRKRVEAGIGLCEL
jgi:hypothetical protein